MSNAKAVATTLKGLGVEWQDVSAEARVKAASLADLVVEEKFIRRRSREGQSIRLTLTPPSWRDYAIRITHVGDAQIDLRYGREGFYFMLCQSVQMVMSKQPPGTLPGTTLLLNLLHPAGFDIEQPHELVAMVQGDRIRSWIDGRLVCDVRDSSYAEGTGAVTFVPQTQLQRVEIFQLPRTSSPP